MLSSSKRKWTKRFRIHEREPSPVGVGEDETTQQATQIPVS